MQIRKKGHIKDRKVVLTVDFKANGVVDLYLQKDDNTPSDKIFRDVVSALMEVMKGNYKEIP